VKSLVCLEKTTVDKFMRRECALFASVRRADHLSSDITELDTVYYIRHRIETVRRIWETARTDALALSSMVWEDYDSARRWAEYLTEEMSHDRLFLLDLAKHGVSPKMVAATAPFTSTQALLGWLQSRISELGSLPAVAYSIFVEWNSKRSAPLALQRATKAFGANYVRGAKAHMSIDDRDGHEDMMLSIADGVMSARGLSNELLGTLLCEIGTFFRAYFAELDQFAGAARGEQIALWISPPRR
jgi:hypothetical protein